MVKPDVISPARDAARMLSLFATEALLEELLLTPKPGLVDGKNNGSHHDLTLGLMRLSAHTLQDSFYAMALASFGKRPSQQLRERLGALGRIAEQRMLNATGNINTHKGAIWCIGLLTAAAAVLISDPQFYGFTRSDCLQVAGEIAMYRDRQATPVKTNGRRMREKYQVRGAREEAMAGFPALLNVAFPAWDFYAFEPERIRRLNVLLSLIAITDDTCILHRSDFSVLTTVRRYATVITANGGLGITANWKILESLDSYVTEKWVSPGGSADLLAATIFLHKITDQHKTK